MNPHLLDAYSRELLYFKELVEEFAQAHPKIARRLGLHAGEIADPFVERLVQAASFTTARLQLKLDAAFPLLSSRLLETVYPNYVAPTPSIAVARLYPDEQQGNLLEGFRVPRGTAFTSRVPDGERTPCTFRSGLDVTLYPLEIVSARLTGVPPDIPSVERYGAADRPIRGALRLRLRTTGEARFDELRGLDRLSVYLAGDERVASRLFELIHAGAVASVIGMPNRFADSNRSFGVVRDRAIEHTGLAVDESLLPLVGTKFHGHNLLHEYATCPARFWFFTLTGLNAGLRYLTDREAEIVVLLDRFDGSLVEHVDASRFALFCTPVINLFRRTSDPAEVPGTGAEILVRPDRQNGSDYEVFAVEALHGFVSKGAASLEFRPLYWTLLNNEADHGRYFTIRREHGTAKTSYRRYGARTPYVSTDVFVSLVDEDEPDSPLTRLARAAVIETTLTQPIAKSAGAFLAKATDAINETADTILGPRASEQLEREWVDRHFAALREVVTGHADTRSDTQRVETSAGRTGLDGIADLLNDYYAALAIADNALLNNSMPPESEHAAKLKMMADTMPAPLRAVLHQLAVEGSRGVNQGIGRLLSRQVQAAIGDVCRTTIEGNYPFSSDSSRDVGIDDFTRMFAHGGVIDDFFTRTLAPFVDTAAKPWRYRTLPGATEAVQGPDLAPFEHAKAIRDIFFNEVDRRRPSWKVDIRIPELDPTIMSLSLDIDGQTTRYRHGPVGPFTVTWPGPRGGAHAWLVASPSIGPNTSTIAADGPWALMRLLRKGHVIETATLGRTRVVFSFDGREAALDIASAGSAANPLTSDVLATFRCPGTTAMFNLPDSGPPPGLPHGRLPAMPDSGL
ncbi:type VI secretion system baseplate subunit TssF [Burkholderia multivorans]|uniref:type VI secretion system baseplate subunit TssF n=1 Tax=Burkholderia multivorans TaxID=87883 RepID=UPI0026660FC8|nr:type VI secretion system baseplate subunit TssF [Burkholderia multivorans]